MQRVELEVKARDLGDKVKRNLSQLRAEGWIPGTLYGHGEAQDVAVNHRTLQKALHGNKAGLNALFTLKTPSETTLAVIKELQRHYLRQTPIHIDFQRINVKEKLDVSVPSHVIGESPGVKNDGGVLEQITREIRVRCLPDDIPATIDINVSQLGLGQAIKVKDLAPIKGVEILTPPDTIVVNVVAPKVEEVAAPTPAEGAAAAAAAGAEPEVIAKGKKEEEGAEGAKPAAGGAAPAKGGAPAAAAPAKGKEEKKK
ncbi:MAG: 50S ribosomal protein L25 [Elusimicrobia bacterium]|nr:50S ribosomal protein L25 [Elusimicrobiota bacterium]